MAKLVVQLDDGRQLAFPADTPKKIVQRAIDIYAGKRKPGEYSIMERLEGAMARDSALRAAGLGDDLADVDRMNQEAGQIAPPAMSISDFDPSNPVSSGASIVGQNMVESAPTMARPLAGAAVGAGIGSVVPVIGTGIGALVGGGIGALTNLPSYAGENVVAQRDAGVAPEDIDYGTAYAAGGINTALDAYTPLRAFRFVPGLHSGIGAAADQAVKKGFKPFAKRVAGRAAEGVVDEGITEGLQQAVTLGQAGIAAPDQTAMGMIQQNYPDILEAAGTGALVGGGMGGIGGIVRGERAKPQVRTQEEPPPPASPTLSAGDGGYFNIDGVRMFGHVMGIDPDTGVYRVQLADGSMVDLSDAQLEEAVFSNRWQNDKPLALGYDPQPLEGEVLPPDQPAGFLPPAAMVAGEHGIAPLPGETENGYGAQGGLDYTPSKRGKGKFTEFAPTGIGGQTDLSSQSIYDNYARDLEQKDFELRMRDMEAAQRRPASPLQIEGPRGARPGVQVAGPLGIGSYRDYERARAQDSQQQDYDRQAREEAMFRERTGYTGELPSSMPKDERAKRAQMINDLIAVQRRLGQGRTQQEQETPKAAPKQKKKAPKEAKTQQPAAAVKKLTDADAQLYSVDPMEIKIDPQAYQFKGNTDEKGADDSLKPVKQWSDLLANPVLLHERANGELYVADGHQRVNLAQRLRAEGKGPLTIPAKVISEKQGYSVPEARNIGAYMNIANESGTPVDMAKVMRSIEKKEADTSKLPPLPMSMSKPKQRTARDLAKLGDNAFGMVVNGKVPENYARIVGEKMGGSDKDQQQSAVLDLIAKGEPKNEAEARTMVDLALDSGFTPDTQTGLFGDEQIQSSLFKEKSQIINEAMKNLRTAAKTFGQLAKRAGMIEEEGNVLNLDANERRAAEEARGAEALTKLATRKGEMADVLNRLATELRDGTTNRAAAGRQLADAAKRFLNTGENPKTDRGESGVGPRVESKDAGTLPAAPAEKPAPVKEKANEQEQDKESSAQEPSPKQEDAGKESGGAPAKEESSPSKRSGDDEGQTVIPGAEKISDKEFAERRMEGKKESTVTQKPADDGLFDLGARNQKNLFSLGNTDSNGVRYKNAARNINKISDFEAEDAIYDVARQILGAAANKVKLFSHLTGKVGKESVNARGAYIPSDQIIAISMNAPDGPGILRHEAIHFLKDIGLLNGADWQALTGMAKRWRKQFDIDNRYKDAGLDEAGLNEEAIADAYRAWANGALPVPTLMERIMDKMAQFFDGVKQALFNTKGARRWEDVFSAIEDGKYADQVESAPGYKFATSEDGGTTVTSPDGAQVEYATRRDAEYGATQAAINDHLTPDTAKFSLPEKEYEKIKKNLERVIHSDDRPVLQKWQDAWANMRERGFASVVSDFADKLSFGVSDDLHYVKRSQQKKFGDEVKDRKLLGYRMARAVRHIGGTFESSLLFGQLAWDAKNKATGIDMKKKGLLEILAPVMHEKQTSDAFKLYSYARNVTAKNPKMRNGKKVMLSLIDEGKERNMTPEMAKEALAVAKHFTTKIDGKDVNLFERAFDELQEWKKSFLDIAVQTGRLPESMREFWDKADHIPFHRIMEDAEQQVMRGKKSVKLRELTGGRKLFHVVDSGDKIVETFSTMNAAKAALGSYGQGHKIIEGAPLVNDIVENIAHNAITMLENSLRNAAMREIIGSALQTGDAKLVRKQFDNSENGDVIRRAFAKAGMDAEDAPKELLESLTSFMPPPAGNIVSVYIDGKPVHYEVTDPFLMKSMAHLNKSISTNPSLGLLGAAGSSAKGFLTRMVTLSPAFMARNFTRDSMQAYIQGTDNFTPFIDSLKGLKESISSNPDMMELMAYGGDTGWYAVNPEDVKKRLKKVEHEINQGRKGKGKDIVLDWVNPLNMIDNLERVGRRVEMANRIAVYKRALEAGASKAEAAFEAADVLDFGMRGAFQTVQVATSLLPFLNARLQGQWRQFRAMGAGDRDQFNRFWRRAGGLAGVSVLLALINASDEPDNPDSYTALPSWMKDSFWNLPIGRFQREALGMPLEEGDLNFIHIPKPFELGLLTSTIFERAIQSIVGNDKASDSMKAFRDAIVGTLAINPLSNPLFGLPVQLQTNYDAFRGQPIEPLSVQHMDTPERYTEYTSRSAKELAKALDAFGPTRALDLSPIEIEFLINGFTGDIGKLAMSAGDSLFNTLTNQPTKAEPRKDDILGLRSFMSEYPAKSTQYREKLFDLNNEVNELVASMNRANKEGEVDRLRDLMDRPRNKALLSVKPQVNALVQQMREQRAALRQVQADPRMSAEQKLKYRNMLNQRMNTIASRYRRIEDQVERISAR